ncbi:MAG: MFS transporter [Actinobacteria bacterium]|nr:MFS transporter [Actinomycetota bacterium]
MTSAPVAPTDSPDYAANARFIRPWYWYDWANSAFVTTIGTVLYGPYITSIAKAAACPGQDSDLDCATNLHVLGIPIAPGALAPYTTTFATILSAIVLIFIGAIVDRMERPAKFLGLCAWGGAISAAGLFFVTGTRWQLGAILMVLATVFLGSSLVTYDSMLNQIAAPDDRDKVSSRGWALGYLGGGLLLAVNLVLVTMKPFGLTTGMAVRASMLSAAVWWAVFAIIPIKGMWDLRNAEKPPVAAGESVVGGSIAQLRNTFSDLRAHHPQTMLFLLAYLFFNDGIQTVISSSSLYGAEELKFEQSQLIALILLVQFVAFFGALIFGRIAARVGASKTVLGSLALWTGIVAAAYFVPEKAFIPFVLLGVAIGLVLGGSQALSRSLYSQLVPHKREAEYFALYQAMERGTSWFGTLLFGVVYQLTHTYRLAIIALIIFFVIGGFLLSRVDFREGIRQAGNTQPALI